MNHNPAYEYYPDCDKPQINWNDPKGDWVGIWGTEWQDKQGNLVLEVSEDIIYEVWQPDFRASRIYTHTFENGLVHKLFPAGHAKYLFGYHILDEIFSEEILNELDRIALEKGPVILHINALFSYLNYKIAKKNYKRIPIVAQFYNNSKKIFKPLKKNLLPRRLINRIKLLEISQFYKRIKYLIPGINEGTDNFIQKYGMKVFYRDLYNFPLNMENRTEHINKNEARQKLNISENTFVLLSLSRLTPVKQIDKLLEALSKVQREYLLLIVGQGTNEYIDYLENLAISLGIDKKVRFIGFVKNDEVFNYYAVADVFVSCSKMEGGPTTPFEASGMGIPVVLSTTGIAYEFFRKHNIGKLISNLDSQNWPEIFEKVIEGEKIEVPDIKLIKDFGDRLSIARYYRDIYWDVYKEFHKNIHK